ncbi:hypothetical protein QTH89_08580 [Variovorax sp. J22G21]|uniref:DUF6988 family protein n=1 Tax=Variovorax fucosicus TaxID=3053517 RepID=UPI002575A0C1|nr:MULTISPECIES: hypothetical protein [unclassified Variovorax]MDM0042648.1 hypothetical protein [Variovorax sp. J22R193]MDM0061253.1 hypothetical protein [Variovorax sp. J22G21]
MIARIEKSLELADWIALKFDGMSIVADGKSELSATCYYVVWQHQAAVPRLYREGLIAPATALLRCAWEAFTRGMWLSRAATIEQRATFRSGGKLPGHKALLASLEKVDDFNTPLLTDFHDRHFDELCDLTHTGITQLSQHWCGDEIRAEQEIMQLESVLALVDTLALCALAQAAVLAGDQPKAHEAMERLSIEISQTEAQSVSPDNRAAAQAAP